MNIGIIGNGKMGNEIFWIAFNSGNYTDIYCVEKAEEYKQKIIRQLDRLLKRNVINEGLYKTLMNSFKVSQNINDLSDCDIVIEAIPENTALKADLFRELEKAVKDDCILATNTSSIPLKDIFSKCNNKQRCAGLHFFYPVKMNSYIEINTEDFTSEQTKEKLSGFVANLEKTPVFFPGKFNMFINMIIAIVSSHAYLSIDRNKISVKDANEKIFSDQMECTVFDIIESVGIKIIGVSVRNFRNADNIQLLNWYIEHVLDNQDFAKQDSLNDVLKCKEEIMYSFYAVMMNCIVHAYTDGKCNTDAIKSILEDMFMMRKGFNEVYAECGYNYLTSFLDMYNGILPCSVYKKKNISDYDLVFCERSNHG